MGLGVAGGEDYGSIRVTIDGNTLVDDKALSGSNAGQASSNTGHAMLLPFQSSMLVEVRDRPNPSSLTKYWASWVSDHSEEIRAPREFDIPGESGQRIRYRETVFKGDGNTTYFVTELVGPVRWSYVDLERDTYRTSNAVSGVVTLREEPAGRVLEEATFVPLAMRVMGRQTPLADIPEVPVNARFRVDISGAPVSLPLEIVASLPGYVNVPGRFIIV
jgi:hypothetical protein